MAFDTATGERKERAVADDHFRKEKSMGLRTQAAIAEHLTVSEICRRLRIAARATDAVAKSTHREDYWIVAFTGPNGSPRLVDAFLNSWAAEDYPGLIDGLSTLLSMELGPDSEEILRAITLPSQAWIRRQEGATWSSVC